MRLRNVVNTSVDEKCRGAPLLRAVKTCRRKTIGKIISSTRAGVATVSYTHLTLPTKA